MHPAHSRCDRFSTIVQIRRLQVRMYAYNTISVPEVNAALVQLPSTLLLSTSTSLHAITQSSIKQTAAKHSDRAVLAPAAACMFAVPSYSFCLLLHVGDLQTRRGVDDRHGYVTLLRRRAQIHSYSEHCACASCNVCRC